LRAQLSNYLCGRSYTRVAFTRSADRGCSWSPKQPLTEALQSNPDSNPWWNCPRLSTLSEGQLATVIDRIVGRSESDLQEQLSWLWSSSDDGQSWQVQSRSSTPLWNTNPPGIFQGIAAHSIKHITWRSPVT